MSDPRTRGRGRFGQRRVGAATTTCPTPTQLRFHVDANRDGVVDDDWTHNALWEPGVGKHGAIMLCNCDDDDPAATKAEDNIDDRINTADDNTDIAPLHIRKHPAGCPIPAGWRAIVEVDVDVAKRMRIFSKDVAPGTEVLGPATPAPASGTVVSFSLPDLATLDEWKYGMEATQYPGRRKYPPGDLRRGPNGVGNNTDIWNGLVELRVKLLDAAGTVQHEDKVKVRCAPWVMFTHFDPTEQLYVMSTGDNAEFIRELRGAIGSSPLEEWPHGDRWMQDIMELGFSTLPKPAGFAGEPHLRAPIPTFNDRDIARQVKDKVLGKNYGYYEVQSFGSGSSLDSFGNLECVPPFTHPRTGVEYKFGRIVYGMGGAGLHDHMVEETRDFLRNQKVQFPFDVYTGWLQVGHVDEVFSFLPLASAPKKFKVLIAAPQKALDILNAIPPADRATTRMFHDPARPGGEPLPGGWPGLPPERTVAAVLASRDLAEAQTFAMTNIAAIKQKLKDEVGLEDDEFIELPMLFTKYNRDAGRVTSQAIAFTAGSVNMLVVTEGARTLAGTRTVRLVVPKPFGPIVGGRCKFEEEIERVLTLPGVSFRFVDDFYTYHNGMGEIHCGTNSLRKGPTDRLWWHQQGI